MAQNPERIFFFASESVISRAFGGRVRTVLYMKNFYVSNAVDDNSQNFSNNIAGSLYAGVERLGDASAKPADSSKFHFSISFHRVTSEVTNSLVGSLDTVEIAKSRYYAGPGLNAASMKPQEVFLIGNLPTTITVLAQYGDDSATAERFPDLEVTINPQLTYAAFREYAKVDMTVGALGTFYDDGESGITMPYVRLSPKQTGVTFSMTSHIKRKGSSDGSTVLSAPAVSPYIDYGLYSEDAGGVARATAALTPYAQTLSDGSNVDVATMAAANMLGTALYGLRPIVDMTADQIAQLKYAFLRAEISDEERAELTKLISGMNFLEYGLLYTEIDTSDKTSIVHSIVTDYHQLGYLVMDGNGWMTGYQIDGGGKDSFLTAYGPDGTARRVALFGYGEDGKVRATA